MDSALIGFFIMSFILLAALAGLGKLVNAVAKRPVLNGAAICFWLLLLAIAALLLYTMLAPSITHRGAYLAGQTTAVLLPAVLISLLLARSFRRKKHSLIKNYKQR